MLNKSIHAIVRKVKINHQYDIPYIAGYSKSGKTIYVDRRLPLYLTTKKNQKIKIEQYLVLHEIIEKSLIKELGHIYYEYAHEIATIAELEAVKRNKINVKEYNEFMAKYAKKIEHEQVRKSPKDLDLKPYLDEKDYQHVSALKKAKSSR